VLGLVLGLHRTLGIYNLNHMLTYSDAQNTPGQSMN
jgi:hypothetical protein